MIKHCSSFYFDSQNNRNAPKQHLRVEYRKIPTDLITLKWWVLMSCKVRCSGLAYISELHRYRRLNDLLLFDKFIVYLCETNLGVEIIHGLIEQNSMQANWKRNTIASTFSNVSVWLNHSISDCGVFHVKVDKSEACDLSHWCRHSFITELNHDIVTIKANVPNTMQISESIILNLNYLKDWKTGNKLQHFGLNFELTFWWVPGSPTLNVIPI